VLQGSTGAQGVQGATGSTGAQGVQGAIGPSTAINATAVTTNASFFPVFVAAAGSNQTASVKSAATAFSFNPSTNTLSATTFIGNLLGNATTVTNGVYTNTSQIISGTKQFYSDNVVIGNAAGGLSRLECLGTGGASFMTFHRPGAFATYLGLDTDNVIKVGGWSNGAASYPVLLGNKTDQTANHLWITEIPHQQYVLTRY
jgi:hypothetical protein